MTGNTAGLLPPAERAARAEEKTRLVLRFLRQQVFSSESILARVMGVNTRQGAHRTLARMESEDYLRRAVIENPTGGRGLTLWGITPHGQAFAADDGEAVSGRYFEPGRVAYSTLAHTLDVQRVRLALESAGWTEWQDGDTLGDMPKGGKRPDGVVRDPNGQRVAVEVERTLKTPKRYQDILAAYLQAIKRGDFDRVLWLSPTPAIAERVRRVLTGLRYVRVGGQQVAIDPARHHAGLSFLSFQEIEQ